MQMPDGIPRHYLFYPNYVWQRPRQRSLAFLSPGADRVSTRLVSEHGEVYGTYPWTRAGWDAISGTVATNRMTVFCRFGHGWPVFPWMRSAIEDEQARVLATPARGPVGVIVKRSRFTGSFASLGGYHADEVQMRFDHPSGLAVLRRIEPVLGVGVHDSAAGLGTAVLYRAWKEQRLRSILRLPQSMQDLMLRYRCGGRVQTALGYYPTADEYDIKQAYPTIVRDGLPWGDAVFSARDVHEECRASGYPCFALWRIRVHEEIENSPLPLKNWDHPEETSVWRLPVGWYDYAGWGDELDALIATGRATCDWRYGWYWGPLSQELAPWVDEMAAYRDHFTALGDHDAATIIKHATNATIGKWGCDPERLELVSVEDERAGDGMVYGRGWLMLDAPGEAPDFTYGRDEGGSRCVPTHLCSYVRMKVRMEMYRLAEEARRREIRVVMENVDAITTEQPLFGSLSEMFTYHHKHFVDALVPRPRSLIAWIQRPQGWERFEMFPGVAQEHREALRQQWQETVQLRFEETHDDPERPDRGAGAGPDRISLPDPDYRQPDLPVAVCLSPDGRVVSGDAPDTRHPRGPVRRTRLRSPPNADVPQRSSGLDVVRGPPG